MDLLAKLLGKKVYVCDIEAKGFLNVIHTFDDLHVLSYGYWEGDDWKIGSTKNRDAIKRLFENPDNVVVGHFFLGYDIRALKKMIPEMEVKAFIIDTLTLSQYLYNERLKHGLEDWGVTLGFEKVKISDEEWANLSYEKAVERCERDVLINCLLWAEIEKFLFELYAPDYKSLVGAIKRCNFKNILLSIQDENRILVDVEKCKKNLHYLEGIIEEKIEGLKKILPKVPIKTTKNKPKVMYKKDGSYSKAGIEWLSLLERAKLPLDYEGSLELIKGYEEPNPTSTQQLKDYLFSKSWKPKIFKDGANGKVPQLRDDNKNLCSSILELIEEVPELELLQGLSVAQHRAAYLKAFLDTMDENSCVAAGWTGIAKTFRVKHNKPIVNLPSNSSQYGELVRSCLIAPPGKVFVNADMSSLEDKTKQCCIYPYDPKYVESLNQPGYDAHLTIALLGGFMDQGDVDFYKWFSEFQGVGEGCPDKYKNLSIDEMKIQYKALSKIRKSSKVVNYSATYSASAKKIAESGGMSLKEATTLRDAFWELNWSVRKFAEDLKTKEVEGKTFIWNPYTKLYLFLSSEHIRFSACNQNFGMCVFELFVYYLIEEGIKPIMTIHK